MADMISEAHLQLAQRIVARCQTLPQVVAVAIGGSLATGQGNIHSDLDLYLYTSAVLSHAQRHALTAPDTRYWQSVDYWGPGEMAFDTITGLELDIIYFDQHWMSAQIERLLVQHQASMGYTTALWHTVRHSRLLFDREDWFADLQAQAHQPYPAALSQAIVKLNYPLLRDIIPSYRRQIASALANADRVSLNHRLAALLSSYFDILFAVNGQTHPGEKRLLDLAERSCPRLPNAMRSDIETMLRLAGQADENVLVALDGCLDRLAAWLKTEGYLT
jgi:hypothetical protein